MTPASAVCVGDRVRFDVSRSATGPTTVAGVVENVAVSAGPHGSAVLLTVDKHRHVLAGGQQVDVMTRVLTSDEPPPPGCEEALALGCRCVPTHAGEPTTDCPVHWPADDPTRRDADGDPIPF